MKRILAAFLAAVVAWLCAAQSGAAVSVPASAVQTYAYDGYQATSRMTDATPDRGPPSGTSRVAALNAVDHWSHGASPRVDAPKQFATSTYGHTTPLVHVDSEATTTSGREQATRADLSSLARSGVAAETGGAASVRLGQAGESAVRSAYDIGPKASADIAGRTRIFDGLTDTTVSEVKNVARQSFTLQLRDSLSYAQSTGRTFDLYVRQDTYLTGPLRDAIGRGDINLRFIP